MDAEFVPRVFTRPSQGALGRISSEAGLGLGPSNVEHIVKAGGGTIEAASAGLGRGLTFAVEPPPSQAEGEDISAPDTDASKGPLAPLGVLVVEDDDASAVLATVLMDRGALVRLQASYATPA